KRRNSQRLRSERCGHCCGQTIRDRRTKGSSDRKQMKSWCFAVAIFGALVRFAAAAEPNGRAESLTIDLPTALRLAGARNIDIQLAREKLAEAHAEEESAIERFFSVDCARRHVSSP